MTYTEDQIFDLFDKAPQEVKDALESQELLDAIGSYKTSYGLHVDTMGKVAELSRNLLLGITSPTDFYGELVLVGVSAENAQKIVDDLDKKIFTPLRDKMRAAKPEPVPAPAPRAPQPVVPVPTIGTPPTPPAPVPTPLPQPPVTPPPVPPMPKPVPPQPVELPTPPSSHAPEEPHVTHTMARDIEMMNQPQPQQQPTTPAPAPVPATPKMDDRLARPVTPPPPGTPEPQHKDVVESLKQYGIDPYREPLD